MKQSFPPITNKKIKILILGSLPGEESLKQQEYYAHPRNKFWKVIAVITKSESPVTYSDKLKMLELHNIGVWDLVHKADRIGRMDTAIKNAIPNDLNNFIVKHPNIKIIAFNGLKAQALFDKHFKRNRHISYFCLPSTSPANAGISFEKICNLWAKIIT